MKRKNFKKIKEKYKKKIENISFLHQLNEEQNHLSEEINKEDQMITPNEIFIKKTIIIAIFLLIIILFGFSILMLISLNKKFILSKNKKETKTEIQIIQDINNKDKDNNNNENNSNNNILLQSSDIKKIFSEKSVKNIILDDYKISSNISYNISLLEQTLKKKYGIKHLEPYGNDFPDKIFLLIGRNFPSSGIFSHYLSNLGGINLALEYGLIPVVDMKNSINLYSNGSINIWEEFFDQPYTLDQVEKAKNVFLFRGLLPRKSRPSDLLVFLTNKTLINHYHKIAKKYCPIKQQILDEAEKEYQQLFKGSNNVLGIRLRGTDYNKNKAKFHPKQPRAEDVIEDAKKIDEENKYDYIYLSTEDLEIETKFRNVFGNKIKMSSMKTVNYTKGWFSYAANYKGDLQKGREYIIAIVILSKCKYILSSRVSAVPSFVIFSNRTENIRFYDYGDY